MGLFGTVAEDISGLFSTGVAQGTKNGDLTPEIKQQLLERRWSYMNRKTKKPLIRLWDKEMQFICAIDQVESWSWEEMALEDGEAKVTFAGTNNAWIREIVTYQTKVGEDLHVTFDPDPDKPHDWKNRWGGKVLIVEDVEEAQLAAYTTLHCISNRRHLRGVLLGANPIFPMEVQNSENVPVGRTLRIHVRLLNMDQPIPGCNPQRFLPDPAEHIRSAVLAGQYLTTQLANTSHAD